MKLIIDIPEEEYKCLDYYQAINQPIFKAIKNGIPLEDVLDKIKGEIDKAYDDLDGYDPYALGTFANMVSEIMDKYSGVSE